MSRVQTFPLRSFSAERLATLSFIAVLPFVSLSAGAFIVADAKRAVALAAVPIIAVVYAAPRTAFLFAVAMAIVVPHYIHHSWLAAPLVGTAIVADRLSKGGARIQSLDVVFAAWLLWNFLEWRFHPELAVSPRVFLAQWFAMLFYVWARLTVETAFLVRLLWTLLGAGTFAAITVLFEWRRGSVVFSDPTQYQWSHGDLFRAGGVFGGSPTAAIALGMIVLATFPLVRTRPRLVLSCFGIILTAIVVTYSRAGVVGLLVGIAVAGALTPYRRIGRMTYAIAVASLAAALAWPAISGSDTFREGVVRPGSTATRLSFLTLAHPLATDTREHFLVGRGFNAFMSVGVHDRGAVNAAPILFERGGPHNEYMRALLEEGAIGVALLTFWAGGALLSGARVARRLQAGSDQRLRIATLAGAVAVFLAGGMFHDLSHNVPDLTLGALLIGVLVSTCVSEQSRPMPRTAG